ncbi:cytochrome P450 [Alkalihalophilus marmarensis]|uniref:cytochrome P450 n=1 Tax=Alkalihalophilus marmarensis TaxID=521377 RepID=UPI002E1E1B40|nr:cytochrome P450 [Alkalihalophilus marmarensis]MED1602012.1 cytochrome P450 [Alkalihalophilus marmarensis]
MKTSQANIPSEKGLDHSLSLLKDGYLFIHKRAQDFQSDIFKTRLMGEEAICLRGEDGAKVFYDNDKFKREGAAPKRVQKTLFGEDAIQSMDGEAHRHRKQLFMSLMSRERLQELNEITRAQWLLYIKKWETQKKIVLFDEMEAMLTKVACEWAGVPLEEKEVEKRTKDFGDMIDAFGAVGVRHARGRSARKRTEAWITSLIEEVRSEQRSPRESTALYQMAWHKELDGTLMDAKMAAIELINVIRPTVAVGRFITFGAVGLHEFPKEREKLMQDQDGTYSHLFTQEVRRYYPFAPFTGARVKKDFTWNSHQFKENTLVLLDIYGTNRHPKLWESPNEFRPERFKGWEGSPFSFIPQGGGDENKGHRCAGEWITIELMKISLSQLAQNITYDVPKQDLSYDLSRMPSIPKSRFIIQDVRRRQ